MKDDGGRAIWGSAAWEALHLFPSLRMAQPSSSLPTYFLLWSTLLPKLKACKISAFRYTAAFLHGVGLQTDLCVDRHRGRHLHQIGRKLMLVDCSTS